MALNNPESNPPTNTPDGSASNPEKVHSPGNEVDCYERLQVSAEKQIGRIGTAYELHASLIASVVKYGSAIAALMVTLGGFLFFHSLSEFKEQLNQELQTHLKSAEAQVDKSIVSMTNRVENEMAEENKTISLTINEKFRTEKIDPLIEATVSNRVQTVTEAFIEQEIRQQIYPELTILHNNLETLKTNLLIANATSDDIQSGLDTTMNMTMALNDDRFALSAIYYQFLRGDPKAQRALSHALASIADKYSIPESPFQAYEFNWKNYNFDPKTNELPAFVELLRKLPDPISQTLVIQAIADQTNIPRFSKLEFYTTQMETTPSIRILDKLCKIVNNDCHLNRTVLLSAYYIDWVHEQMAPTIISNVNEAIKLNPTNIDLYLQRAISYCEITNFSAALADYKRALTIDPTNELAQNNYAWFLAVCPDTNFQGCPLQKYSILRDRGREREAANI